jgi:hypothetical protein
MTDFEDIYDALKGAVAALGGAKKAGPMIRPEAADAAQWLRNCLNREHAQKLDPEQTALLLRLACEAGYHDAKHWVDGSLGYEPAVPLALEAQLADALKAVQAHRRRAEADERDLRLLIDNPRLLATMRAAGLKVEA